MDLPKSTYVNRFIPKEKFYAKTSIGNSLKQKFTNEIERITWTHKISPETLNISSKEYIELQVFEVKLKNSEISASVIKHIDTFIPYPILFIVKSPKGQKAVISYKEQNQKADNKMKVDKLYETDWKEQIELELKGLSVDEIYKNFLIQIAPQLKSVKKAETTTKQAVEIDKQNEKIQKEIDAINRKIKSEPAIAKKQALARKRHELENQLNSS